MAGYILIGNTSTIQVLGPNSSQAVEVATIQTSPSGVVAAMPVDEADFTAGTAGPLLQDFANSIEAVISQGKAVSGTATSDLNASGLTEYYVTFTVAYNPPGAPKGGVTTDVDVPVGLLSEADSFIGGTLLSEAEALVNTAYDNLVKMSKG